MKKVLGIMIFLVKHLGAPEIFNLPPSITGIILSSIYSFGKSLEELGCYCLRTSHLSVPSSWSLSSLPFLPFSSDISLNSGNCFDSSLKQNIWVP